MATKTKTQKTNRLAKAKFVVKKINNDLVDASFKAIETSVKAGEKWQKLTSKLIKKSEPLTKKQIAMFLETAENIKGQVELGTNRLKTLVGYDSTMLDKAKNMVTENPLVEKAEKMAAKFKKDISENPMVIKAEKMGLKLKNEATEAFEDVKDKFEDFTEDVVEEVKEKVGKVVKTEKKVTKKKTVTKKKAVAKKKIVAKKPVIVKSSVKNDLKTIKGIGPKMEEVLNSIGITSYEQLAKIAIKDIDAALSLAGINTKVYNTSDWKAQARIAIKENK
ncbi:MAG: hypothetical protein L3J14_05320 [Flavobacteriaceae bacterium]|nr:hypothetical protein [Flavobacteriaceae bacterium]